MRNEKKGQRAVHFAEVPKLRSRRYSKKKNVDNAKKASELFNYDF